MRRGFFRVAMLSGFAAVLLIPVGCGGRTQSQTQIELPETPIVSIRDRWGVITGSYVRVREEPGEDAAISDYVRRGVIVEIGEVMDVDADEAAARWLKIAGGDAAGWVAESEVALYESRARAENAARQILDNGEGE